MIFTHMFNSQFRSSSKGEQTEDGRTTSARSYALLLYTGLLSHLHLALSTPLSVVGIVGRTVILFSVTLILLTRYITSRSLKCTLMLGNKKLEAIEKAKLTFLPPPHTHTHTHTHELLDSLPCEAETGTPCDHDTSCSLPSHPCLAYCRQEWEAFILSLLGLTFSWILWIVNGCLRACIFGILQFSE